MGLAKELPLILLVEIMALCFVKKTSILFSNAS